MKKTLVIGASENPSRYAFMAIERLRRNGHTVIAIGRKEGLVNDVVIETGKPDLKGVDTITLYINPQQQQEMQEYILNINPKRIIFNPGTENPALEALANEKGIETMEACTLTLLSVGLY